MCVNVGVVEINNDLQTMSVEAVATKHSLSPQIVWLHKQACLSVSKSKVFESKVETVEKENVDLVVLENVLTGYRSRVVEDVRAFVDKEIDSPTATIKDYLMVLEYYRKIPK